MSFFDEFKDYVLADNDIAMYRINICSQCEFLKKHTRCEKCGCFMKVKTRLATARCPIGKWEKEYDFIKGKKVNGIIHTT